MQYVCRLWRSTEIAEMTLVIQGHRWPLDSIEDMQVPINVQWKQSLYLAPFPRYSHLFIWRGMTLKMFRLLINSWYKANSMSHRSNIRDICITFKTLVLKSLQYLKWPIKVTQGHHGLIEDMRFPISHPLVIHPSFTVFDIRARARTDQWFLNSRCTLSQKRPLYFCL